MRRLICFQNIQRNSFSRFYPRGFWLGNCLTLLPSASLLRKHFTVHTIFTNIVAYFSSWQWLEDILIELNFEKHPFCTLTTFQLRNSHAPLVRPRPIWRNWNWNQMDFNVGPNIRLSAKDHVWQYSFHKVTNFRRIGISPPLPYWPNHFSPLLLSSLMRTHCT